MKLWLRLYVHPYPEINLYIDAYNFNLRFFFLGEGVYKISSTMAFKVYIVTNMYISQEIHLNNDNQLLRAKVCHSIYHQSTLTLTHSLLYV